MRLAIALAVLTIATLLSGCGASQFANLPVVGLPEGAPERPAVAPAYPAVHDMPPPRPTPMLTEEEQRKLEADLKRVRDRAEAERKRELASSGATKP